MSSLLALYFPEATEVFGGRESPVLTWPMGVKSPMGTEIGAVSLVVRVVVVGI